MRRLALMLVALAAVAAPAAVAALPRAPGDGTLVIRNADNGEGVEGDPVVVLSVHGSAIGQITDQGRIRIDALQQGGDNAPEVTGATWHKEVSSIGTAWGGTSLRFRAIDGWYRITIWGSKVNLFTIGTGKAIVVGQPDTPKGDGKYSLEGAAFVSLPADPTALDFGTVTQPLAGG